MKIKNGKDSGILTIDLIIISRSYWLSLKFSFPLITFNYFQFIFHVRLSFFELTKKCVPLLFWSPLTFQGTSYLPQLHISADRSQCLLSAQEAVSLWVLATRKVCILTETKKKNENKK